MLCVDTDGDGFARQPARGVGKSRGCGTGEGGADCTWGRLRGGRRDNGRVLLSMLLKASGRPSGSGETKLKLQLIIEAVPCR